MGGVTGTGDEPRHWYVEWLKATVIFKNPLSTTNMLLALLTTYTILHKTWPVILQIGARGLG